MRPVNKGQSPQAYTRYQDAYRDLVNRLGDFCSYCERQIETNLAVEHVQPKSRVHQLRNAWHNFLLGCTNCNSCKGNQRVRLADFLWPDIDNTLRAFVYDDAGIVSANQNQPAAIRAKAQATIALVGLDRWPGNQGKEPTDADRRWFRRREVWKLAKKDAERLNQHDSVAVRELIVENAVARGMFSIWWTAFAGDADMRRRLREAFIGTDAGSFDANEDLVARAGGQV